VAINSITDDNGTPGNTADDFTAVGVMVAYNGIQYNAGDTNHNGLLDLTETWLFTASTTVQAGAYLNTATVRATQPTTGQTASSTDVAGYYGMTGAGQGLTPGYWKNHPTLWPVDSSGRPIFSNDQLVSSIFGPIPAAEASETLLQALGNGGGGVDALLRAAVAALLNTTSALIDYPWTGSTLVAAVDAALASGDATKINNLQIALNAWNNLGATLTAPGAVAPSASVGSTTVTRPTSGQTAVTLTVTLSAPVADGSTIDWSTVAGTATPGLDYEVGSGTLTFSGGQTSATLTVYVDARAGAPANVTFDVVLSSPVGMTIGAGTGVVTIASPVATPVTITAAGGTISVPTKKNATIAVVVKLSAASTTPVTITLTTVDGTAKAGIDYQALTTTLTFAPGTTSQSVTITILVHKAGSLSKYFVLALSNPTPSGATLVNGTVTISGTSLLATAPAASPTTEPLEAGAAASVLRVARAAWIGAGADAVTLDSVRLVVTDLPGAEVADTVGTTVYLDATAAGWGWSAGAPEAARMDLLSVLEHELGHVLGLSHGTSARYGDVMLPTLAPGVRRTLPVIATPDGGVSAVAGSPVLTLAAPLALPKGSGVLAFRRAAPPLVLAQALPLVSAQALPLVSAQAPPATAAVVGGSAGGLTALGAALCALLALLAISQRRRNRWGIPS
jgi:hypothetical protein